MINPAELSRAVGNERRRVIKVSVRIGVQGGAGLRIVKAEKRKILLGKQPAPAAPSCQREQAMGTITEVTASTITVSVPLKVRRQNGRPKVVLPASEDGGPLAPADDHRRTTLLRAIARAWGWRRRLEGGEFATLQDIADAEKVTVSFVSRQIRLAYLAPRLIVSVLNGQAAGLTTEKLAFAALRCWATKSGPLGLTRATL